MSHPACDTLLVNRQSPSDVNLDLERAARVGLEEAILCEYKSIDQIRIILETAQEAARSLLLTRVTAAQADALVGPFALAHDPVGRTATLGVRPAPSGPARTCVVTAGTSDTPVAREALATLRYHGHDATEIYDVGVAGLWRLLERADEIAAHDVVIIVAGMDGALPSVVAGLVPGLVIAVPTSVGYGVSDQGITAMRSALASCAAGLVVVNIDNGYGAACAAIRTLGRAR